MKEFRIIMYLGMYYEIDYADPVWAGDYLRSLAQCYDWEQVYDNGLSTFNGVYKVTIF